MHQGAEGAWPTHEAETPGKGEERAEHPTLRRSLAWRDCESDGDVRAQAMGWCLSDEEWATAIEGPG